METALIAPHTREYHSARLMGIAKTIANRIEAQFVGSKVIVFGSVRDGRATASSDIDVAVFMDGVADFYGRAKMSACIRKSLLDIYRSEDFAGLDILVFDRKKLTEPKETLSPILKEVLSHE